MEVEKKPPVVSDLGAWGMNVVSSVGIIMANKQLMSSAGYAFSCGTPSPRPPPSPALDPPPWDLTRCCPPLTPLLAPTQPPR